MKTMTLFVTVMLAGLTTVNASEITSEKNNGILDETRYRYTQPIMFVERGVEFLVFPDGSFDFNTETETYGDVYYRSNTTSSRTRRGSVNTTYGSPAQTHYGGVLITHDRDGRVRRIGNVFINYDRAGKIKRAGSVYMSYNRGNGRLTQVGGLRVNYNSWGEIVNLFGFVNHESFFMNNISDVAQNSIYHDDYGYYDEEYYYYKQGTEVKKLKKLKR